MKRNIVYIIGVVCMMTSCVGGLFNNVTPPEGDITFTAELSNPETKTLYGTDKGGSFVVNWVHNDLITVFGDACTAVPQAEYRVATVSVDNGIETPISGQNAASYLSKTGAAGVQWGSATESRFYAVYPSTNYEFANNTNGDGAQVRTTIRPVQNTKFVFDNSRKCWVGTPYVQNVNNPTMQDALMYAVTDEIVATEDDVNLTFKPWSTVLKFAFKGFDYTLVGAENLTVSVKKIILTAPNQYIAGDLMLDIMKTGTATATPIAMLDGYESNHNNSNTITIIPDYLPLSENESVEFCVYIIPHNNLALGTGQNDIWKITIETGDGMKYVFPLKPSGGQVGNGVPLSAGQIHKASIPVLKIDKPGSLSGSQSNWMEKIPRNVYLSELSLPGSWYSTDSKYSGTTSLDELYSNGIRAFHINCCLDQNNVLKCSGDKGEVTEKTVYDQLVTLNRLAAQHPKEYITVVLSVAESASDNGSINPEKVLKAIDNLLNTNTFTQLYDKEITPNTTVSDVLNHMLVLVNANTKNVYNKSWFNGPALIAEASLALDNNGDIVKGSFNNMNERLLYWGESAGSNSSLNYYYHHAQRTTEDYDFLASHPTFGAREDAIDDIIEQSDAIYLNSSHNAWFMMGIGGYKVFMISLGFTESTTRVAEVLNPYLLNWIQRKLAKEQGLYPSPVGIVLMNHPLNSSYYGPALIEAIMNMNAAFPLAADPDKEEDTGESKPEQIAGWVEVSTWEDFYLN